MFLQPNAVQSKSTGLLRPAPASLFKINYNTRRTTFCVTQPLQKIPKGESAARWFRKSLWGLAQVHNVQYLSGAAVGAEERKEKGQRTGG